MYKEADAVVIGAGVAGSSMAYALAKKGWNVVLLDKEKYPRHKACGEFLSPESQFALQKFGLEHILRSLEPAIITKVRIHTEGGYSLEIPLPGQAWGLSRYALDSRLQSSAIEMGASLYTSCTVNNITANGEGYRVESCRSSDNFSFNTRAVIGAGGRRTLNGLREPKPSPNNRTFVGIKSHYTREDRSPVVDLYFFQGGYIGISPVEGGRLNIAALLLNSAFQSLGGSSVIERILEQACRNSPILKQRLAGVAPIPGTQAATFPVTVRRVPSAWNEIPCIGDAIAVIPPFCGDGMSMALRSVELCVPLADCYLRGQCAREEWKTEYTRLIKRHFSSALRWGNLLERVLSHSVLSSWLLRLGSFAPGTAQRLVRATRLKN
ncbi:NAD(P)/FAD-dependent oxidoreductase [Cohnella yongneupensis]|uniref:NAD(P)/FAD-dependent oxidoreductase n=1 Tax=Cohnella yongneupensis TaxID=425006 RepID=A0ABW0QUF8_9BACL